MASRESPSAGRKREVVAEIKAAHNENRRLYRQHRWREIRCFWTWPLGHVYYERACVYCNHAKQMF